MSVNVSNTNRDSPLNLTFYLKQTQDSRVFVLFIFPREINSTLLDFNEKENKKELEHAGHQHEGQFDGEF